MRFQVVHCCTTAQYRVSSVFTRYGSLNEERVFLDEYIFPESNRYTDLVKQQFAEKFPETPCTSSCCS
jgi:hypothetical protein